MTNHGFDATPQPINATDISTPGSGESVCMEHEIQRLGSGLPVPFVQFSVLGILQSDLQQTCIGQEKDKIASASQSYVGLFGLVRNGGLRR